MLNDTSQITVTALLLRFYNAFACVYTHTAGMNSRFLYQYQFILLYSAKYRSRWYFYRERYSEIWDIHETVDLTEKLRWTM